MVRTAGGIPVSLTPGPVDEVPTILDRLDGLVLSGGGDVEPSRYNGSTHPSVYGVDPERDAFEVALIHEAHARSLPTLCICRGLQVLNVALGGTLIADISSEDPDLIDHRRLDMSASTRQHRVDLVAGTATALALGADSVEVNSLHHQAVRDVAPGLQVTGRSPDGLVEALAPTDDWPMWAVQWHPESLGATDDASTRLFKTFVEAAANR